MNKNRFDKQFELRYFEMNEFGVASPTTILTLLEETAAEHCYSINHSLYQLAEQNIGWVLISGLMQMERYPSYKEKITITTWLSKYSTIKGFRENIIYDEQNNIIGRAKGLWIFFDTIKRRPVQIFEDIISKWSFCNEESIDYNISKKIKAVENSDYELDFKVNRYDTDINKHLNNIRYLQWVIESIPDEIIDNYYLYSIDGRFIAEAHYNQSIVSLTKNDAMDTKDKSFIHTIKIEGTDKVCATAKSTWKKIETQTHNNT
ncbi:MULTISPECIES: acyl-[acyl-carrier-protein] thioesterase [Maribacter]|uniref:acyl-[acyl-carrier-protein] thioesterase n=1 Tax=Maribacter TaxID=252356 RepID=UPI000E3177BD|nr:acyl-ACP thioesterase domain-containing protein [Maribacter litoralis]|tara:strand:+ start:3775 stop:4557 length:783 start_codon:yes stop_codon:yes gene_type:complete